MKLPEVRRVGYSFVGWYDKNQNLIGQPGDSYTPKENVTLYVKWEKPTESIEATESNQKYVLDGVDYYKAPVQILVKGSYEYFPVIRNYVMYHNKAKSSTENPYIFLIDKGDCTESDEFKVSAWCENSKGCCSDMKHLNFTLDYTAPEVSGINIMPEEKQSIIEFHATDRQSGIARLVLEKEENGGWVEEQTIDTKEDEYHEATKTFAISEENFLEFYRIKAEDHLGNISYSETINAIPLTLEASLEKITGEKSGIYDCMTYMQYGAMEAIIKASAKGNPNIIKYEMCDELKVLGVADVTHKIQHPKLVVEDEMSFTIPDTVEFNKVYTIKIIAQRKKDKKEQSVTLQFKVVEYDYKAVKPVIIYQNGQ